LPIRNGSVSTLFSRPQEILAGHTEQKLFD
jgi:hypothetical protein